MVFSSLEFILGFLPIFLFCYFLTPNKSKNEILLLGSLIFYFVGTIHTPYHFILFLMCIVIDFIVGLGIEEYTNYKKALLIACITFHIVVLCIFKYSNFIFNELNISFNIALPIGISFYTFQGISYVVDVYKGKSRAEKSLLNFAVYISMFEQLIAGPIVTYEQVKRELHHRTIKPYIVLNGACTFIFGLGLKVLLANPLSKLWSQVTSIGFESISTPLAWLGIVAYSFHIYFDFFGYSLMALGLGKMLGFHLPKNFDHPYTSLTMTDFFRRWHITLGSWFKEYIYIPLGGNRKGSKRTILNLLIVWLLTGIWHGGGYNFLLWGLSIFLLIIIEKLAIGQYLTAYPILGHIYMIFMIPLSWSIFAINDINQLRIFFTRLFPFFGQGMWSIFRYDYLKYLSHYYPFFIVAILFSTRLPYKLLKKIQHTLLVYLLIAVIFVACLYCLYRGFDDPFLYFRF